MQNPEAKPTFHFLQKVKNISWDGGKNIFFC
jgi:hypothetical protein